MSDIKDWDAAASNNSSASPDGFPEGMLPAGLNNSSREVMAAIRRWFEDAQWINLGYSCTYASANSFTIAGTDVTADFPVGRRVKVEDATNQYGRVSSVAFATDTTVTLEMDDSDTLTVAMNGETVSVGVQAGPAAGIEAFPKGSVFMSTVSTNPATLLGYGTWTQIAQGRTLIGEGAGAGLTARTAGAEGGQEDAIVPNHTHPIDHGHTASSNTTGSHTHTSPHGNGSNDSGGQGGATGVISNGSLQTGSAGSHSHTITVNDHSGNSGAASGGEAVTDKNMPPYLVTYIWERTG